MRMAIGMAVSLTARDRIARRCTGVRGSRRLTLAAPRRPYQNASRPHPAEAGYSQHGRIGAICGLPRRHLLLAQPEGGIIIRVP